MIVSLILLVLLPGWTAQNPSLDSVIGGLSQHIKSTMDAQPTVVCDEKMAWADHITESEYRRVRKDAPMGYQIVVSRRVKALDGKSVREGAGYAGPPFNGIVPYFSVLLLPDNYLFSIHGSEFINNTSVIILEFETKPDVSQRTQVFTSGKAWVDPKSLQILRLEDRMRNEGRTVFNSVDYTNIEIDHKTVSVPKTAKSEVVEGHKIITGVNGDYAAEYRNCRKAE